MKLKHDLAGAGKSTLMKLLCDDLNPTDGLIRKHSHLRIARFHQVRPVQTYVIASIDFFSNSILPTN